MMTMRLQMKTIAGIFLPLAMALAASSAFAQDHGVVANTVLQRYPAGSIRSTADADAALEAVRKERKAVDARYAADEKLCYPKFFATNCIEEAQDRRYQEMGQLRKVEVEANAFKRQARVEQRDKALAEHDAKEEVKRQQKAASAEAQQAPAAQGSEGSAEPAGKVRTRIFTDRVAGHEAKMKRLKEEDAAGVQERADNVAAYEKKVEAAKLHQQKVAERKAEKERKRQMKQGAIATQQAPEQSPPPAQQSR